MPDKFDTALDEVVDFTDDMSDWECNFINDIRIKRANGTKLQPRELQKLMEIWEKYVK